jgi:hypothetical protein
MKLDNTRRWFNEHSRAGDLAAVGILTILWALYFWRVLTPIAANQVSLPLGDFSGQFVAFGAYQARRLLSGQIPLWNPFNYGGHPFLADTQSAVFYPPRLVTIFLSQWLPNGFGYSALQGEAIAHFWLASFFMYLYVRTITRSKIAGIVSAITVTYSGFLTGYPPLQLAILEAGIWLPLGLLGIHQASAAEQRTGLQSLAWLSLSSVAMGISLLAGHPQTSLFMAYLLIAYILYWGLSEHHSLLWIFFALSWVMSLAFGIAAIQLLPGIEYTRLTTRADISIDQLANGFPFSDIITAILPNTLSLWSPLYNGIAPLILAGIAIWHHVRSARFWGITALISLGLSFGGATLLFTLAYLIIPGFTLFREQERFAYIIAYSIAILAGLGTSALLSGQVSYDEPLSKALRLAVFGAWALTIILFIFSRALPTPDLDKSLRASSLFTILVTACWVVIGRGSLWVKRPWWPAALIILIVFDLFSVTMHTNWQPIPASARKLTTDLVPVALEDESLFRVDGRFGLGANYGTMVGLQDIRGISPLTLATVDAYLKIPQYRLHQIMAVKYVFTDWQQLEVPSKVLAQVEQNGQIWYLHEISEPFPRAWMTYIVMDTPDRGQALGWLSDPGFDPRRVVILSKQSNLQLPQQAPQDSEVKIVSYAPEKIVLDVNTSADGVLVLSELDCPGWRATVNGHPAAIWQADAGLRALPLQGGRYAISFEYRPTSFTIGAILTFLSLITAIIVISSWMIRSRRGQTEGILT